LTFCIVILLLGGLSLLYAGTIHQLQPAPPSAKTKSVIVQIDPARLELTLSPNLKVPLQGSHFYYPNDHYTARLPQPLEPIENRAPGFVVTQSQDQLSIDRSELVKFFARFLLALQWVVALSALAVTMSVVIGGRKPEVAMFTWCTALLFALPAMRGMMVGAPEIGIYLDFFGFLCCEGVVVFCLTLLVMSWLIRKP
jgi:hypothetical protein